MLQHFYEHFSEEKCHTFLEDVFIKLFDKLQKIKTIENIFLIQKRQLD